ncbi:thioesterase family protein [Catellatospora aurea]|uniref:Thioesterase family protein n=1 Tax=Catellatospora aurea TaxID=1337874 RepID=A0ABW2H4S2_9ACTN
MSRSDTWPEHDPAVAFYTQVSENRFASTEHTRGPWSADTQHAGPPAALLGRAVEQLARPGMRIARITYDIARPVPIAPLTVSATVVREGRSTMIVSAAIEPYMRCTALVIRTASGVAPDIVREAPSGPADAVPRPFIPVPYSVGYHTAMEIRFVDGSFLDPGPATAWMRMRGTLVEGEKPSPLARVLVAADSGNGLSMVLDIDKHVFVNPDLSVHLLRYPVGTWVCLKSRSYIDGAGIGFADTELYDELGNLGRSAQSLFVNPR